METYFDSHLDLLQRNLAKTSDRLKMRAEETLNDIKKDVLKDGRFKIMPSSSVQLERELQRYRLKVQTCERTRSGPVPDPYALYRFPNGCWQ